jgi:hypothetical protein
MESASFLALDYESYSTDLNSTQIGGEWYGSINSSVQ